MLRIPFYRTYPVCGPNPPARMDMLVRAPPAMPQGSRPGVEPGARQGCHAVQLLPSSFSCPFIVVMLGSMMVGVLDLLWSFGHMSPTLPFVFGVYGALLSGKPVGTGEPVSLQIVQPIVQPCLFLGLFLVGRGHWDQRGGGIIRETST